MKKLQRSNPEIDFAKLFSKSGIDEYDEPAFRKFAADVTQRLAEVTGRESSVRGLRTEAVFAAVVAGLGKVKLLKEEDSGDAFFRGEDIMIPDYRMVLADDTQLLVEVKAAGMETIHDLFKLGDGYVQALRRYASLTRTELRIAIFWDGLRHWTLNRLDAFEKGEAGVKKWSIDFPRAMATNEMAAIGDMTVLTRAPLRFRVALDPANSDPIPESGGHGTVVIDRLQLLSDTRVLSPESASLAWKLIQYGNWDEVRQDSQRDGDKIRWIDYVIGPLDDPRDWESHMCFIGSLSQMVTRAYMAGAEKTIHTTTKSEVLTPGQAGRLIPNDFMTRYPDLPIALIEQEPNFA